MIRKKAVFILLLSLLLISLTFDTTEAQKPPNNATGYFHSIQVVQGDIPDTPEIEEQNTLTVYDTMLYTIPANITRIYLHVPEGGALLNFYCVHGEYNDSTAGLSGYPNWYYWEFPSNVTRDNVTTLAMSATYVFISDEDPPVFSFEKELLYDIALTNLLVYVDGGYEIEGSNITWANQSAIDPAMWEDIQKPGKEISIGTVGIDSTFSLSISPEEGGFPFTLAIIGLIILVFILLGAFLLVRKKEKSEVVEKPPSDRDEDDAVDADAETLIQGGVEADVGEGESEVKIKGNNERGELLVRKENILKAIRRLDADLEEGLLTEEAHGDLKAKYKKEAIEIMKELDRTRV
jgi:uncharacterized protein YneF (UPF0154 family)